MEVSFNAVNTTVNLHEILCRTQNTPHDTYGLLKEAFGDKALSRSAGSE